MIERMPINKEILAAKEPDILTRGKRLETLASRHPSEPLPEVFNDTLLRGQLIQEIDQKTVAESTALKEKGGIRAQVAILGTGPHATAFASALRHEYPDVSFVFIEKNKRRGGQFREDYATFKLNSPTIAPGSYGVPFESDDPNTLGEHTALKVPQVETEKFPTNKKLSDVNVIDNFDTGVSVLQTEALGVSRNKDSGSYTITACDLETNTNITINADVVIAAPGMGKPQQEGGPHHTNYFSPYEFMHYIHQKSPEEIVSMVMDGVALVGDGDSAKVAIEQLIERTEGHPLTGAKIHLYGAEFSNQEEYLEKNIPRYHSIAPYIGEGLDRLSIIPHSERVDDHTETDDGSLEFTLSDGTKAGPFKTSVFATGYENSVEELFNPLLTDKELEYVYDEKTGYALAKTIAGEHIYITGPAADIPYTPEEIDAIPANMRRRYRNGLRRTIPRTEEVAKHVAQYLKSLEPRETNSGIIKAMPTTETPSTREPAPITPEAPKGGHDMVGLRARLAANNQVVLNPTVSIPENLHLIPFQNRDYTPFERASRNDRKKSYDPNDSFEEQYKAWEQNVTNTFTDEKHMDKVTQLGSLFHTMGVDINGEKPFAATDAKKLFDTYFDDKDGVKKFVADVIKTYQSQADGGYTTINNQIDNITWMANMFGTEGKEMVRELILTEITLFTNPTYFEGATAIVKDKDGNDTMRINQLNPQEEKILSFIMGNQEEDEEPSTPQRERTGERTGALPIEKHKQEIKDALRNNDTVIIIGGTGSGKTVGTPQFMRELLEPGEKMLVTQPRQINTTELAKRVAELQGVTLGKEIGYHHGDENKTTPETDTSFVTEGLLLRQIANDPLLKDYNYVMMDEVHVRSKDSELLLQILKEIQKKRKNHPDLKPLKLVAASATVEKQKLVDYLPGSQTVEVEGRTHPILERYTNDFMDHPLDEKKLPQEIAQVVDTIIKGDEEGDILIFDAGLGDLESIQKALASRNFENIQISTLHSGSTEAEKEEASKPPTPGVRRVIVGTNFVETGVTIKGLKFVINTGREFERRVDPRTGLEYMDKIKQSKAGIAQRSGRVGRMTPGTVYNMFSKADYDSRQEYPTAELERTDLTDFVLALKQRKVENILGIDLLSQLNPDRVRFAEETLRRLDAIGADGKLTSIGEQMEKLPVDYHLARAIVEAKATGKGVSETCRIAAMTEARNITTGDQNKQKETLKKFKNPTSDFLTLLNIWKEFEANGKTREWAEANGLSYEALTKSDKTYAKLVDHVKLPPGAPAATDSELGRNIYQGHKDRLMRYNSTGVRPSYVWTRDEACNINFHINPDSALNPNRPDYIVSASNDVVKASTRNLKVSRCQAVDPSWVTS